MEALVTKSTGSWYELRNDRGETFRGRIRGKLRLEGLKTTNPIAVGDRVICEEESHGLFVISAVKPRRNYIIRKSNNLSKQKQIIAANLDQLLVVVTMVTPRTSTGFIDRVLVTAEAYHVPVVIAFNKIDIYEEEAIEVLKEYERIYESIGYDCIQISALRGTNLSELREKLENKTTLFSGHSGVGKSSLLNALAPDIDQKTAEISSYSEKGKHTTTFAEMFHIGDNTRIIDTPGLKDFGVVDLEEQEISHYFPEMKPLIGNCRFNNCLHVEEPACAVKQALEDGRISPYRYYSYLSILGNEDVHH